MIIPLRDSSPSPDLSRPKEHLLQRSYRKLIRQHLDKLLDKLLADFTGLHFHISWAPSPPREWSARMLPTACSACCRISGSPLLKECRICGPQQLARALKRDGEGLCFTCRLGVRNYWVPVRVRDELLGIAYLQALDHAIGRRTGRGCAAHAVRSRLSHHDAKQMDRSGFSRAARLLRLIVQHVQTASLNDLRKVELTNAGRAVVALEKEQARLHESLERHLPPTPSHAARHDPESHPEQIVQQLLDWVSQNYAGAITLRGCAAELGMNAAYLSDLFSRAVGVSFKTHLTELRMEKSKALLSDPLKTISDVAEAVGYASENRFRVAFKKATGLSPKLWRETMRVNPSPPPTS